MKDGKPWRVRKAEMAEAAQKKRAELIRKKPAPVEKKPWPTVPEGHNPHRPRGIIPWDYAPMWKGEVVCIIGGGYSLRSEEGKWLVQQTKGHKVIAINNAYKVDAETGVGAPWADMLFFADCQWWRWNDKEVKARWPKDKLLVTSTSDTTHCTDESAGRPLQRLWRSRNGWSTKKHELFGYDGGTQAVNLAFHLGAARIVLFGIDMQPGPNGQAQYHKHHKRPTAIANYNVKFIPTMKEAVKQCQKAGIEIVRATPGFDIGAPMMDIVEALKPVVPAAGCLGDLMPLTSPAVNE